MTQIMQLPNTKATQTGLTIQPGIEFDSWQEIGKQLGQVNQGLLWWIGDWLNYGESSYGETYAQAMDVTGKAYATVKQAAYMARKYKQEIRDSRLTFSHYGVVAGLSDDIGLRLLKLAGDNSWTVKDLKAKREEMEESIDPKPEKKSYMVSIDELCRCPACNAEFSPQDYMFTPDEKTVTDAAPA